MQRRLGKGLDLAAHLRSLRDLGPGAELVRRTSFAADWATAFLDALTCNVDKTVPCRALNAYIRLFLVLMHVGLMHPDLLDQPCECGATDVSGDPCVLDGPPRPSRHGLQAGRAPLAPRPGGGVAHQGSSAPQGRRQHMQHTGDAHGRRTGQAAVPRGTAETTGGRSRLRAGLGSTGHASRRHRAQPDGPDLHQIEHRAPREAGGDGRPEEESESE